VSEKLVISSTTTRGLEVIAAQDIKRGELLVVYGGGFIDTAHLYLIPTEMRPYFFQVADGIWFGHGLDEKGLGIAERIDHSCDPSAGFKGISDIVALRDIPRGEPITVDYSGWQSEDLDGSVFECHCESPECRQTVSFDDWQRFPASSASVPDMQPFIQAKIDRNASNEASSFSDISFPDQWYSPQVGGELQSTLISRSIELEGDGRARARAPIPKGQVVLVASGKIVHRSLLDQSDDLSRSQFRPINGDLFVGPRGPSDVTPWQVARVDDSQANIGSRLGHFFVAIRDINVGEEIVLHSGRTTLRSFRPVEKTDSPNPLQELRPVPIGASSVRAPISQCDLSSGASTCSRHEPVSASSAVVSDTSAVVRDPSTSLGTTLARTTRRIFNAIGSFVKGAVVEDWMAAPIALAGSAASTLVTALCVARCAPIFEQMFNSTSSWGYVFATSTTAVVLGYASYCLFYYGGMVLKERAELLDESGTWSRERVQEKLKVFMWDFLLHLPSDIYWVGGMFSVQGGLYASGSTDLFWSIILSQGVSDIYYSLREPFYWRAAKNAAAKLAERRSTIGTDVANSDVVSSSGKGEVGNS
jgi:hypothetical protein